MSGALDMGEYLGATWTATRRTPPAGGLIDDTRDALRSLALVRPVPSPFSPWSTFPPASAPQAPASGPKYDLLLRGGHVIDARNKISAVRDVAIAGGKIAAVDAKLNPADALKTVDVVGAVRHAGPHRHPRAHLRGHGRARLLCR